MDDMRPSREIIIAATILLNSQLTHFFHHNILKLILIPVLQEPSNLWLTDVITGFELSLKQSWPAQEARNLPKSIVDQVGTLGGLDGDKKLERR
jgi:hypothetical protein